jgi:hypothetical protein
VNFFQGLIYDWGKALGKTRAFFKFKKQVMDKTIEFLRDYNRWRRGAEIPQPNPTEIGVAINTLIEEYIKLSNERDQILAEIIDCEEEIISSPIRFNGVHVNKIKEVFINHGVRFEIGF